MKRRTARTAALAGAATLTVVALATAVQAQGSSPRISACVGGGANPVMHYLSAGGRCKGKNRLVTWEAQGARGATGARGPAGAGVSVVSVTVPRGSHDLIGSGGGVQLVGFCGGGSGSGTASVLAVINGTTLKGAADSHGLGHVTFHQAPSGGRFDGAEIARVTTTTAALNDRVSFDLASTGPLSGSLRLQAGKAAACEFSGSLAS